MHCHTTRSDGNDTSLELILNAAALHMQVIGLTDHDIDPPRKIAGPDGVETDIVLFARQHGIELVPGYEFSCDTHVDDVHICGYCLDWDHADLRAEVEAAKRSKSRAYEELCTRLTERGMPVDWENDVLVYRDSQGLAARRDPDEVQRKHIFEAMAARGHAKTWSEAKIMVRDNPDLNVPRRKIDPLEAIALIHRCGGLAVLAHPYLIDEQVKSPGQAVRSRDQYIGRLLAAGLDGIEACYTYDKTSYKGSLSPEQIEPEVRAAYAGRVKFFSGGSDYHADHKKGSKNVRLLGERGISVEEFGLFKACLKGKP
jgi:predicted metal-dependent phosphoesterase TrpH